MQTARFKFTRALVPHGQFALVYLRGEPAAEFWKRLGKKRVGFVCVVGPFEWGKTESINPGSQPGPEHVLRARADKDQSIMAVVQRLVVWGPIYPACSVFHVNVDGTDVAYFGGAASHKQLELHHGLVDRTKFGQGGVDVLFEDGFTGSVSRAPERPRRTLPPWPGRDTRSPRAFLPKQPT